MSDENTPIPIKIQLNSERAVRKLLDGDPDLQIMVKKEIARSIATAYMELIKASVDTKEIVKDVEQAVRNSINAEMITFKTGGNGYSRFPVINTEYQNMLKAGITATVNNMVISETPNIEARIKQRIDYLNVFAEDRIKKFTTEIAEIVTSESIQRDVDIKVDEKLAAIKEAL